MDISSTLDLAEAIDLSSLDVAAAPSWDRRELSSKNQEVLRLHFEGLSNKEISLVTGFTTMAVSQILRGTLGNGKLLALNERADIDTVNMKNRIDGLQGKALDVLEQVLEDEAVSKALKVKTAQDLLDRGGNSRITKVETTDKGYLGVVGIDNIKRRAAELGFVSEAEFSPIEPTRDVQSEVQENS